MTEAYQKALREVQRQIEGKIRQRDKLSAEIVQLQATQIGLQNALGQQVQAETQWTELVSAVINNNLGQPMSAVEVRNTLQQWGYTFAGVNNPLAFINTCLQRLAQRRVIVRVGERPTRFDRAISSGIGSLG
ncbi:MAG TPA: hypothetical protein VGD60_01790 [Candidatus Acidoferrales bacterium]